MRTDPIEPTTEYFFIDSSGEVQIAKWFDTAEDEKRLKNGNVFETYQEALKFIQKKFPKLK